MSLTALAWIIVFVSLVALSFKRAAYGLSLYLFTMFLLPQMWWWGDELPDFRWNLLAACVFLLGE